MSYCSNPHAPKARRAAVNEVVRDDSFVVDIAPKKAAFRNGLQRSSNSPERCSKIYLAYCKTWSNSACRLG